MIDLNAIKARLAAATPGPWRRGENRRGRSSATIYARRAVVVRFVDNSRDAILIANAPTDISALIAEVERLRALLDGPPICACGGTFIEHVYDADEGHPRAFGYHCPDCGWQIGNNGEITERLTLRTNPQTERLIARIFGR